MNAVEIKNFTKFYGKARGTKDISLVVEQGDFFGFIGPNGAGKSTTIRTMMGLITPTSGSVRIFGKDIQDSKTEILKRVGYLPSEITFYQNMKVKDVLKFSSEIRKKDCRESAAELCQRLKLDINKKVDELSLGNRKKVGIICAMQHDPDLYVMDEPTSGLDPLMQREMYSLLVEKNKKGATVFLSSHILSEVQKYCKHAAFIRDGQILISEEVEKLENKGAKIVTCQGISNIPEGLDKAEMIRREEGMVSFLYGGAADTLLKTLSAASISDLTIEEPDLEDIFMHYYARGEK